MNITLIKNQISLNNFKLRSNMSSLFQPAFQFYIEALLYTQIHSLQILSFFFTLSSRNLAKALTF